MVKFIVVCCLFAVVLQATSTPLVKPRSGMFGNKFQGDIQLTQKQKDLLAARKNGITPNTGLTYPGDHWHMNLEGFVVVPYRMQASEGFTQAEIDFMLYEFGLIEAKTCIRFVERTNQIDFVDIISDDGCWSWLGRIGGGQEISMGPGCFWLGTAAHEMIHALGYDHMHNAEERDDYVRIVWENIQPGTEFNFDTVDPQWFSNFGTPYDLKSVMHYPRWAFTINGEDTIIPHDPAYLDIIGEVQFSDGDATRLNRMYQCVNH